MPRKCRLKECGKELIDVTSRRRYCSDKCRLKNKTIRELKQKRDQRILNNSLIKINYKKREFPQLSYSNKIFPLIDIVSQNKKTNVSNWIKKLNLKRTHKKKQYSYWRNGIFVRKEVTVLFTSLKQIEEIISGIEDLYIKDKNISRKESITILIKTRDIIVKHIEENGVPE